MKCPKCGAEIKDGSLFCEKCFADIRIVPEYDNVEERISETMNNITQALERDDKREERRQKRQEEIVKAKKKIFLVAIGAVSALIAVAIIYKIFDLNFKNSEAYYVGVAYSSADKGNYEKAASEMNMAVSLAKENRPSLVIRKAEYLHKAGQDEDAILALKTLINEDLERDELLSAYSLLITIYSDTGDYDTIAQLLAQTQNDFICNAYSEYMTFEPVFSVEPGVYKEEFDLMILTGGNGTVFYTLDGTEPDTSSMLYKEPINLQQGTYDIKAVYINPYGAKSDVMEGIYKISAAVPTAPELSSKPGFYNKPVSIEVTADLQDDELIYYTDDGTNPTRESLQYTQPISLEQGTSNYLFAVISDDGVSSEIVGGEYTYSPSQNNVLSSTEAADNIITALIRRGEIIGTDGTAANGIASFSYAYECMTSIEGYGEFYVFNEYLTDQVGNRAATGRKFAVNANNGTVNLYENGEISPIG